MAATVLFPTKFLSLKQTDKGEHPWAYAHRDNAKNVVVTLPIIKDKLVLLETARPPVMEEKNIHSCIELPAGLVADEDKNENSKDAAIKEIAEETGFAVKSIKQLASNIPSSPGCVSETFDIFMAELGDKIREATTDNGVIKNILAIPITQVMSFLKEQEKLGKGVTAQTYAAVSFLLNNIIQNNNKVETNKGAEKKSFGQKLSDLWQSFKALFQG